jgi:heme/copper-type cytochrome/quinol oxidase subunit 2
MVTHKLKNPDLIFTITCVLAVVSAIVGVTCFILFIRARMRGDEVREEHYKKIHYIALTLFLLFLVAALNLYEDPY